jgi:hypothetical protein
VGSLLSGAAQQRMPWGVPATAAAAWGSRALSGPPPPEAKVEPEYDPELLRALQIDHIPPARIADALRSENITIEQLKMLVDEGFHQSPGGANLTMSAAEQAAMSREASEWSMDLVHQLNPRRRFFPGQTYLPEELSPNYQVDYSKLREEQRKLGCPLGGKKGPKLDFTNVATLSRYVAAAPAAPAAPFPAVRSRAAQAKCEAWCIWGTLTLDVWQIPDGGRPDYSAPQDDGLRQETGLLSAPLLYALVAPATQRRRQALKCTCGGMCMPCRSRCATEGTRAYPCAHRQHCARRRGNV